MQRLQAIFDGVVSCDVADRAAYLEQACAGDRSLLAEIRALLRAYDHAGSFLESTVVVTALTAFIDSHDESPAAGANVANAIREGDVVSHYRLERRVGAGGMGVVYLAHDLALDRPAALKILPETFTPALQRRLRAEGAACARLQHPAIATFYDAGESEGTSFVAMEFVRGRSLRERLSDGPLPLDEAVAIAECLLEAISHAHAAGILHRDIKPENIILTGPRSAKLLDFGLAKLIAAANIDPMTGACLTGSAVVGTVGYMSPEQIRNESLDVRSDVFQIGAVLYEMVTGRPAFPGVTVAQRLASVLTADPPPLGDSADLLALNAVVARALSRDRARRYPSSGALLSDLWRIGEGRWSAVLPAILAVLDLHNTGAADDDWIGSGLAETMGATLARTPDLTLIPRDKVEQARAACRSTTPAEMAVEVGLTLGCRWVLGGTYRKLGPALRVKSHIVEVSTGRVVSTTEVDGTLEQIFQIQDRIIADTCASLTVEAAAAPANAPATLSAYECYHRGRQFMLKRERDAFVRADELFGEAIRLDPQYAEALAGLARTTAMRFTFRTEPAVLKTAIQFARRAIDAAPTLVDSYIWLGYSLWRLGLHAEADAAFGRCLELDPNEKYGYYFGGRARWPRDPNRSIQLTQRAVEIDRTFGLGWWGLGCMHLTLGHYPEASFCFDRCSVANSMVGAATVHGIGGYWGECLRRMGRFDDARTKCLAGLDEVERSDFMYRDTNRVMCLIALGRTAADQGDTDGARTAFEQAIAHVKGRPRTLAGGTLVVRALAGLARLYRLTDLYAEARQRESTREEFDFSWVCLCDDFVTYEELAETAQVLGKEDDARAYLARAKETGPAVAES
jgi:serine/threonine-protein kinase